MSLIAEISTYDEDIGASKIIRDIINGVFDIGAGGDTRTYISKTICRGILQNDISINFTNNWGQTAYQGLYQGLASLSNTKVLGTSLDVIKAGVDFASTAMNMGGISLVGAGAASTRIYQGSSISGFNVTMKWYTPKDSTYIESLQALMILGFPSLRAPLERSDHQGDYKKGPESGVLSKISGSILNFAGKVTDTLSTLASYNPPVLKVRVFDPSNNDVFRLYPMVISSISINASRETFSQGGKRIPIVITATVGFEFYQVLGNQGYNPDPLIIAGVPVLGAMK